jgi:exosortase/archaeosortase family protein
MNKTKDLILRYFILIVVALPGLSLFYLLFSPLTFYPSYWLLNLFYDASICISCNNIPTILISALRIEIIGACVAGSAYYFLLILNLATPKIQIEKRLKMLGLGFGVFLVLNILRIFSMGLLYVSGSPLFDFAHKFIWYIGTTLFVVGIWFIEVKLFKIKEIPFYSDVKELYSTTKRK